MEVDVFRFSDQYGPAKILFLQDQSNGLQSIVVVDNVALGPAIGGVRMAPDVNVEEAFRLARAMTLKNAAAALPHGGGKAVIVGDPNMPRQKKERLIRLFAKAIRNLEEYIPGPDMGTDEFCMGWIKNEIGHAVGLPRSMGGIPLDEIGATGWGVCHAVEAAMKELGLPLKGARVVVQGFGTVGAHSARFLAQRGAVLVAASDIGGAVVDPDGLDLEQLLRLRAERRPLIEYQGAQPMPREAVLDVPCEIWIPAARPDVVNEENVHRLNTRMVAQGANIPLTDGAESWLHQKGVLVLPDFIANAGGVICGAMDYAGLDEQVVLNSIRDRVRDNVEQMLETMRQFNIPPREAAMRQAVDRLEKAMNHRQVA